MSEGLLAKLRALLAGGTVGRALRDEGTSAEILLLTRLVLADGTASEAEMQALRHICGDAFGLHGKDFDAAIAYLGDYGYETTGAQAAAVFRDLPEDRRRAVVDRLIAIAKADRAVDPREVRLIARAGEILGIDPRSLIAHRG